MHRYFPHTPHDIKLMLDKCGVKELDDLYADVPPELRLKKPYNLPPEMSEQQVRKFFNTLGADNEQLICFAGAGYYDHYTPAIIPQMIERGEFLTAYTPYQPEISQGTLQYIFEYQSMMANLTGMDVSNASMYDGTTATAEAMLMAIAHARKRNKVLISSTVAPAVRKVCATYAQYHGVELIEIPTTETGISDRTFVETQLANNDVAGVIVATPNFYGILEDYSGWADMCHQHKTLFIIHAIASDLACIKTPGEWGADIAAGDAQSLGMPLNYGGPYLGFLCCTKALIRKLPGRIVGATTDSNGKRVFVLTLQAREQHIRRDKATSNICSNQGLMSLFTAMYLSVTGAEGLREICREGYNGAHYLAKQLVETGRFTLTYPHSEFFNEFCLTAQGINLDELMELCVANGILPGVKIESDKLLVAVTETRSRQEMNRLIELVNTL
ncbi:MAG: aminomethyl-transferring glycine dehydrogenase subunit GcvPA [Paramuribaculum sp.]|nr:aminomethyl-transferring glycine dehydrogenase subunit GcvPA [Paramuribaculum sp.]